MSASSHRSINVRLTDEEAQMLERFQQELQKFYGPSVKVTQRTVIVQALEQLANYLQEKGQPRGQKQP